MEKENLYKLIKSNSLEYTSLDKLKKVVDEYPYFQTARILYTKKLQSTGDENYGEELSKTAVLCADRRKLFYLTEPDKYEKLHYKPENNLPEDKDRTEALLDSYFTSIGSEEVNNSPIETTGLTYASMDYFSYLESLEVEEGTDSSNESFEHQDIIDSFINKNESDSIHIRPFKDNNDSKINISTETGKIDIGNEFLTETLAKIYIKQKKYEQALTIIKRLSLTFPKKSSYFADQIRFLEYLIINEKNK